MTDATQPAPAQQSFADAKILIYSHDTFGLGHLRRCREIAHALVEAYSGLSILIISGSTIAGAFDYRTRVDFVKVPSVIKLRNGEYTSLAQHLPLADTLNMRRTIIQHTARTFAPDIFIVDKEPAGLKGEIEDTLAMLKSRGTRLVLGLREVMDAPHLLMSEWAKSGNMEKVQRYYDTVWVYGPERFHDPLRGLPVPDEVRHRMRYTGFLRRQARDGVASHMTTAEFDDYILVTTGGGGDGENVIRQVLAAYTVAGDTMPPAVFVLGPYLPAQAREDLHAAGAEIPNIQMIDFDNRLEDLVAGASGVAGMAGYNTFCEILSFDKPSLLLPRTEPREEQLIRAQHAAALGWSRLLLPEQADDPHIMAQALAELPDQAPPSASQHPVELDGLDRIVGDVGHWLEDRRTLPVTALNA